jgi:hypothetical protein
MLRTKLMAIMMVLAFAGTAGAVETVKLTVKDAAGTKDVLTVGDAGSVVIGNPSTTVSGKINSYGTINLFSPTSYPFGINMDMSQVKSGSWAREFSYTADSSKGTGKLFAMGAFGNAVTDQAQVTTTNFWYGYIGGNSGSTLVYNTPWMVFLRNGNVGIGVPPPLQDPTANPAPVQSPTQKLEVNGGVRLNTSTTQPACNATSRGTIWFTKDPQNFNDQLEVCAIKAGNDGWQPLF